MYQNNSLKLLSSALLIAGLVTTSAWGQAAMPAPPVDAATPASAPPVTRAEVKAQTKAAQRAGEIPQGEAGTTKDHPMGGAIAVGPNSKKGEMTRAEVKAEARRAEKAGEIPKGEGDVTKAQPQGGAKIPKVSATTRAAVKAEAKRAEQAGEMTKGESGVIKKTL